MFTLSVGREDIDVNNLVRVCAREQPDEWRLTLKSGPPGAPRAGLPADAVPGAEVTLVWPYGKFSLRLVGWETAPTKQGARTVIASTITQGTDPITRYVWQGKLTGLLSSPAGWVEVDKSAAGDLDKLSLYLCRSAPTEPATDCDNRVLAALVGWLEREAEVPAFLAPHPDKKGGLILRTAGDFPEEPFRHPQDRTRDDRPAHGWGTPPGPTIIDEAWDVPLGGTGAVDRELIDAAGSRGRSTSDSDSFYVTWWKATWHRGPIDRPTLRVQRRWQSSFPVETVATSGRPVGSGWTRWARMKAYVASPEGGGPPVAEVIPLDVSRGQIVALPDAKPLKCQLLTLYGGEGGANCGVHFVPEKGALVAVGTPSVFVRPALLGEVRDAACDPKAFGLFLPKDHVFVLTASKIKFKASDFKVSAETDIGAPSPPAALTPRREPAGAAGAGAPSGKKPSPAKPAQQHRKVVGVVRIGDGSHAGWHLSVTDAAGTTLTPLSEPGHDGRSNADGKALACYKELPSEAVLKLVGSRGEYRARVPLPADGEACFAIATGVKAIKREPAPDPYAPPEPTAADTGPNFLVLHVDPSEVADHPRGKVIPINFPGANTTVDSGKAKAAREGVSYAKKFYKVWEELKEFGLSGKMYFKDIGGKTYAIVTGARPGHPGQFINLRETFKGTKYLRDNAVVVGRGIASTKDAVVSSVRGALKMNWFFFVDVGLTVVEEAMKQEGGWGDIDWPALGGTVVAKKAASIVAGAVGAGIATLALAGTAPVWVVVLAGVGVGIAIKKLVLDPLDEKFGYSHWLGEKTRAVIDSIQESELAKAYMRHMEFCTENAFACIGDKW